MKLKIATISIEQPLYERAKKQAKSRRQGLSGYVCTLIENDVRKGASDQEKKAA